MGNVITVNMAELRAAAAPDALATSGVGSCVAVCLYDPRTRRGGLAHIMLPRGGGSGAAGRYADTGVAALIRRMERGGSEAGGLTAKLAGGASLLTASPEPALTVGKDNLAAVKAVLKDRGVRLIAEDTGGAFGRGVVFRLDTGAVEVTVFSQPPRCFTI